MLTEDESLFITKHNAIRANRRFITLTVSSLISAVVVCSPVTFPQLVALTVPARLHPTVALPGQRKWFLDTSPSYWINRYTKKFTARTLKNRIADQFFKTWSKYR